MAELADLPRSRNDGLRPRRGRVCGGKDHLRRDRGAGWVRADEHDPDYAAQYGVDPGCDDGLVRAVPPVRMRAVWEGLGLLGMAGRVSSICADDYGDVLRRVAERAGPPPYPCLYRCAAVEPPEELWLELPDLRRLEVPQCEREAERFVIPDGAAACWGYREGAEHCRDERLVELVLKRADVSVPSAFLYRRSSGCAEP